MYLAFVFHTADFFLLCPIIKEREGYDLGPLS